MNRLFEAFIAHVAKRALGPLGYRVSTQGPRGWLTKRGAYGQAFSTRPDLHLERQGTVTIVDTKWKRLSPTKGELGISPSDAHQMNAYADVYAASRVIILYPHEASYGDQGGELKTWKLTATDAALSVATITLENPDLAGSRLVDLLAIANSPRCGATSIGSAWSESI
jgi:5-methylcytosine-specific restriction enzyme subunit McrC